MSEPQSPQEIKIFDTADQSRRKAFKDSDVILIAVLITVFALIAVIFNSLVNTEQQFSYMAKSFLRGHLYLTEMPGSWFDAVKHNNLYYWPLGPVPAIILMPFVAIFEKIGLFFYQSYLQLALTTIIFYLCFNIARQFNYSKTDSLYLGFAFVFGSVYQLIAFIAWSWYFAQAVAVFLTFVSIREYFRKRRYWFIGVLWGAVFATRFTAGFGILFFIGAIITEAGQPTKQKIKHLAALFTPVVITGILLLTYNFVRFNDPFDNGYTRVNAHLLNDNQRYELINNGLFQLKNIPTNFYYYFLKTVDPVRQGIISFHGQTYVLKPPYVRAGYPGVSFFIVSPIFLYIFRAVWREKIVKLALAPVLVTLFALLAYFWPGWTQVGPRYTLDFLPFLFLILLFAFNKFTLPKLAKFIIVISSFVNLFLLITVFYK